MAGTFQFEEIRNRFAYVSWPIGYKKFQRLLDNFKHQCDQKFGQEAVLRVKLMTAPPFHQVRAEAHPEDEKQIRQIENNINERNVICRLDDPGKLSKSLYKAAKHIEVTAMTRARAQSGPDYKAEFAGGTLTIGKRKTSVTISLQGLKSPVDISF